MVRQPSHDIDLQAASQAAAELFVLCFPLLMMDAIRRAHPMAPHDFQLLEGEASVLAPGMADEGPDIAVSSAWLDLRDGPVLLSFPEADGRFFSLTLTDSTGDVFARFDTRPGHGTRPALALVGPTWQGGVGRSVTARRVPSDFVWAVSRLEVTDARPARSDRTTRPRNAAIFTQRFDLSHPATHRLGLPATPCIQEVRCLDPATFFHRIRGMSEQAPRGRQQEQLRVVARLQQRMGGPPPQPEWSSEYERCLRDGLADGFAQIDGAVRARAGTSSSAPRPGVAAATALARAADALTTLGAPAPDDVLAVTCDVDATRRRLSGAEHYRLQFDPGSEPPVDAFWRLQTRPPATGPHARLRGPPDLVAKPSGPMSIRVQQQPPPDQTAIWLAAPAGLFSLDLRLYWPRRSALSGAWRPPPIERLGSSENGPASDDLTPQRTSWRPLS